MFLKKRKDIDKINYESGNYELRIFLVLLTPYNRLEAQGGGERKAERQGTMPCEIRPIVVESPQERGLGTDSGEKLKAEAKNVPYKNKKIKQQLFQK